MIAFLNDLATQQNSSDSQIQKDTPLVTSSFSNVRVLCVSDEVVRFFPFWASRSVEQKDDLSKDIDESLFSEENIEHTV